MKERINNRLRKLVHVDDKGEATPYVCVICDEFLTPKTVKVISFERLKKSGSLLERGDVDDWNSMSNDVASHYTYRGYAGEVHAREKRWLKNLILSPRAVYLDASECGNKKAGISICNKCKTSLSKQMMPRFAINNNYALGSPPISIGIAMLSTLLYSRNVANTYGTTMDMYLILF